MKSLSESSLLYYMHRAIHAASSNGKHSTLQALLYQPTTCIIASRLLVSNCAFQYTSNAHTLVWTTKIIMRRYKKASHSIYPGWTSLRHSIYPVGTGKYINEVFSLPFCQLQIIKPISWHTFNILYQRGEIIFNPTFLSIASFLP